MNCPNGDELSLYIDGDLPPSRLEAIAGHLPTCEVCRSEVESLSAVGRVLRAQDPPLSAFEGIDLMPSLRRKLYGPTIFERFLINRFAIAGVAAAIVVAFLTAFYFPWVGSGGICPAPKIAKIVNEVEYLPERAMAWMALNSDISKLSPGTLLRSDADALVAFEDGSSVTLTPGTVVRIGGTRGDNYSFALISGKIYASIKGAAYRISTFPQTFSVSEGIFVLSQGQPYLRGTSRGNEDFGPRTWQWVTTLAVQTGVVECGDDYFAEGSRRDWSYDSPNGTQAAMLERAEIGNQ
ncbi:MAG: zf-HC2 domain-containing protein [Candidatus Brocadiia bacterium]